MDVVTAILENGEQVGIVSLLLLAMFSLVSGLITGRVLIGPQIAELKSALEECSEALEAAQAELRTVEKDLIRLEIEREHLWQRQNR